MNKKIFITVLTGLVMGTVFYAIPTMADGAPEPWGIGFQEAASPVMTRITEFHNFLLYITTAIVIFVFLLLLYIIVKFNAKANPEPNIFSHNTLIEVIWTVVPIIILIVISVPSMKLLYYSDKVENPDMTLKVTGYQWYWGYEYPDHGNLNFLSYMIPEKEIDVSKGQKRLLSTDNIVVLPIDTNIQILVTAADVLHSFSVPSLGVKMDAVPGRMNETWVRIDKPGIYYGQCSELCGKNHAYMPIEVHAVSKKEFAAWLRRAKREFSSLEGLDNSNNNIKLAIAEGL